MPRDRDRRSRDSKDEPDDITFGQDGLQNFNDDFTADLPETQLRAIGLLNDIIRMTPRSDARYDYLLLLRHQLETDEQQLDEAQRVIAEFEEAYQKLTAPANRIGVFMGWAEEGSDDTVQIALGDQEYIALVDPKLENRDFKVGTRIKVNEAFAVIGDLGYHPGGQLVKISDIVDADRIRIGMDSQNTQTRVIFRSTDLRGEPLKPGDEVRVEPNFKVALEHFPSKESREFFLEEVPVLPWEKVGGQEEVIQVIKDAIELPLLHPELFQRFEKQPLKGILLYGPPGCGKTLIGKATAYNLTREYAARTGKDVQEYFMYISGPKILNMWLGETERMVREIFETARTKAKEGHLVFLFIDEAESILRTRSSGRFLNISNTVVPQFCAEMDGLVSLENVVVMLTSNRPDYIDPAILRPERIDRKVKVGRPDRKSSRDILGIYLHAGIPIDPDLAKEHKGDADAARDELLDLATEYLWRKTEETEFVQAHLRSGKVETLHWKDLVSGALLKSVVERSKDFAIKRAISRKSSSSPTEVAAWDNVGVTLEDLQAAIRIEFKENEIFPKGDTQEDWLKLLDYAPEDVATVKAVQPGKKATPAGRRTVL
jgi:proteasome-associated ATPase